MCSSSLYNLLGASAYKTAFWLGGMVVYRKCGWGSQRSSNCMTAIVFFPYGAYCFVSELPTGFLSPTKPGVCRLAWSSVSSFQHPPAFMVYIWQKSSILVFSLLFLCFWLAIFYFPNLLPRSREDQLLPVRERERGRRWAYQGSPCPMVPEWDRHKEGSWASQESGSWGKSAGKSGLRSSHSPTHWSPGLTWNRGPRPMARRCG